MTFPRTPEGLHQEVSAAKDRQIQSLMSELGISEVEARRVLRNSLIDGISPELEGSIQKDLMEMEEKQK
jgi:hypothetical protein